MSINTLSCVAKMKDKLNVIPTSNGGCQMLQYSYTMFQMNSAKPSKFEPKFDGKVSESCFKSKLLTYMAKHPILLSNPSFMFTNFAYFFIIYFLILFLFLTSSQLQWLNFEYCVYKIKNMYIDLWKSNILDIRPYL